MEAPDDPYEVSVRLDPLYDRYVSAVRRLEAYREGKLILTPYEVRTPVNRERGARRRGNGAGEGEGRRGGTRECILLSQCGAYTLNVG